MNAPGLEESDLPSKLVPTRVIRFRELADDPIPTGQDEYSSQPHNSVKSHMEPVASTQTDREIGTGTDTVTLLEG